MATPLLSRVVFKRPVVITKPLQTHPKTVLRTETGDIKFTLPWAPKEVDHDGFSAEYTEVSRAGNEPYLVMSNRRLRGMTLEFTMGHGGRQTGSIETDIRTLEKIAASTQRVYLAYGPTEGGLWRIMEMSVHSLERKHGTNEITAATVSMTFKRNVQTIINLGPTTARPKPTTPTPPKGTPSKKPAAKSSTRYYVVKKGDTLGKISLKYYKTASKWPLIASANKIKNPNLIKVGQKLRIP